MRIDHYFYIIFDNTVVDHNQKYKIKYEKYLFIFEIDSWFNRLFTTISLSS
jgi:hypothetical protein